MSPHPSRPVTRSRPRSLAPAWAKLASAMTLAGVLTSLGQAAPQSFVNASAKVPSGSPDNDSSSENVDFADVDLDGDFDVAFPDGGDCCNDQNRLWINLGGAQGGTIGFFTDETATRFPSLLDDSRDLDFIDVDGDEDPDLYVSNTSQISNQSNHFLINMGGAQGGAAGFFTDQTASHWKSLGVNSGGSGSSVANSLVLASGGFIDWSCDCVFADLDDDGDLDLVHSSYGGTFAGNVPSRLFLNDGAGAFEEFNPSGVQLSGALISSGTPGLWAEGLQQNASNDASGALCDIADTPLGVEVGDLDGDFDVDIVHGARNEYPRVFQNRLAENGGTLGFRDVTATALAQKATGPFNYEQELGDLDDDGDLDLYGINWSNLFDVSIVNDGSGHFGSFAAVALSNKDDNEADWFDFDNDGRLDVFVCAFGTKDRLLRNDGPPGFALIDVTASELPAVGTGSLGGDACDVDGDGDYDFLVGRDAGAPNLLLENVSQVPDTFAPKLPRLEKAPDRQPSAQPTSVRVAVLDNASWNVTQFASARLEVRVDGGPVATYPMRYAGGQVFRGEIPGTLVGLVTYQAKATDGAGNTGASAVKGYNAGTSCAASIATYCTAKPTSIPGCTPSVSFSGLPSASSGSGFTATAGPLPGGGSGLFLYTTKGAAAVPLSNAYGLLCIQPGAGLFRFAAQLGQGTVGTCSGQYAVDFNAFAAGQTNDAALIPGARVDLQCWYRDAANPGGANLTDAGTFVLCP